MSTQGLPNVGAGSSSAGPSSSSTPYDELVQDAVSFEYLTHATHLNCGHSLNQETIERLREKSCPICRVPIETTTIDYTVRHVVEKILEVQQGKTQEKPNTPEEQEEKRQKQVQLESALKAKKALIREIRSRNQAREIGSQKRKEIRRDRREAFRKAMEESDAMVRDYVNAQLEEKDQIIQKYLKALEERDRLLEQHAQALQERDRLLELQAQALQERDQKIVSLQQELQIQTMPQDRYASDIEMAQKISIMSSEIKKLKAQLSELKGRSPANEDHRGASSAESSNGVTEEMLVKTLRKMRA